MDVTSKSTTAATSTTKTSVSKPLVRGNSVSSMTQVDKSCIDSSTLVSSGHKRNGQDSRGSARPTSSKGNSEKKGAVTVPTANKTAQNFSRGRTLTPKVTGAKAAVLGARPSLTAQERLEFDEKREEAILKEAADKKARAQAIRER